jgi:hypothetical protein
MRRRLFWVAWSLNKVLSYEYGRSSVDNPNSNVPSIDNENGCFTYHYVALASMLPKDDLDVHDAEIARVLCRDLTAISALDIHSNEIILMKADLAFCIYCRLRLSQGASADVCSGADSLVIQIGLDALPASSDLAVQHLPWWTVISVPFQLLCVLLAIDSRESLSRIGEATEALEEVGMCWDRHMVKEAVGSASFLIKLSRKRKEEDMEFLVASFPKRSGLHDYLGVTSVQRTVIDNIKVSHERDESIVDAVSTSDAQSPTVPEIAVPENSGWIDEMEPQLQEDFAICCAQKRSIDS